MPTKSAPQTAVSARQPVAPERFVPGIHSVQGINSRIEDMRIRGESLVALIGDAVADATLTRTINGGSSLLVEVHDPSPGRRFLRSSLLAEAHELLLDGLRWKLAKVSCEGINEPIALTYEPLIVYLLKQLKGPHKAFRDTMTRAEFAQARAYEARPRPRFIAPELHVVQPIADAREARERQREADQVRGKGMGRAFDETLQVNGKPATAAQVDILDRMLRVGESYGASTKAQEAMIAAVIVESVVGTFAANLLGMTPETISASGLNPNSPEDSAKGFLKGYVAGHRGAIAVLRANPGLTVYEVAQDVQKSGAGAASRGADNYGKFVDEATAIVAAYGGGGEVTTTSVERYAFEQSKKESNWRCMNRLAGEVRWRCFESAGWIYFIAEDDLLRSPRRMRVSDSAPGIIDTSFDYDVGKEVQTVTVEAYANTWAAPPGSVAAVSRHGPADGLYLVQTMESQPSSRSGIVTVTLKRETEPLPEPRPERNTTSVGFGADGLEGAPAKVQAIIAYIDRATAEGPGYVWGGGHGGFAGPAEGKDCSGFVSAAVHAAGYLTVPLVSGAFPDVFPRGEGDWVTIYANATHVFMTVKYPDGTVRYAGTGGPTGSGGWVDDGNGVSGAGARGDKIACHPPGL